jgi:hypothetical protein
MAPSGRAVTQLPHARYSLANIANDCLPPWAATLKRARNGKAEQSGPVNSWVSKTP